MGDEKNFRSQFYGKVGLREIEDKRAVEALLKEQPLDEKKFAHFCQRSVVPGAYRILVWKLLLRISPRYAESQDYVQQQQTLMFEELFGTLKGVGNAYIAIMGNDINDHCLPDYYKGYQEAPVAEQYLVMWLIREGKLLYNSREQFKEKECQHFLTIVKKISCFFDNPVDIFLVCSSVYSLLLKNENNIADAVQDAIGMLRKENDILHRHLLKLGLFNSSYLVSLCMSLFCDIFPETAIEKIMDKVIAGAFRVFAFVIFSLLMYFKQHLSSVSTVEGVKSAISLLRKEEAEILVNSALEQWLKIGMIKRQRCTCSELLWNSPYLH
ncbi:TBC1 domain family member 7-like [Homarus americanus]|uniref:TBC1 domain family member 7-like n=1 Tax=Homarus americanus TaxID=6706 RepID=UPI001C482CD3|nr:TBC1 domain family member 7-like [Homarus americanus]